MTDRAQLAARLAAALANVPSGRVVTLVTLARHLGTSRPAVLGLLTALDRAARAKLPWHRVVADGGAIGRHALRAAQLAALRLEGVVVSPVGIVEGLAERAVTALDKPAAPILAPQSATSAPRGRSRGMKHRPG